MPDYRARLRERLAEDGLTPSAHAEAIDEISAHLDDLYRAAVRDGSNAEAAVEAELARIGPLAVAVGERARRKSAAVAEPDRFLAGGFSDLRFAVRRLWRSRGFAIVAILMLALGIGVNIAMFTIANTALFKGFSAVRENDRILYLTTTKNAVSYPDYQDWQSQAQSFEGIAMTRGVFTTLGSDSGAPGTYFTTQVTANAFALLGVKPMLGRDFLPSDQHAGATPVVMLRHDLWTSRFAGKPAAIGSVIKLNGVPTVVIGVMPPTFSFPEDQALWTPLVPTEAALKRESFFGRYAFGRLVQGATRESATAEMESIGRHLASAYPNSNSGRLPVVRDFREFFIGEDGTKTYKAMWGAVALVFLIASGNVANLLLNRSVRRSREISVCLALGARRAQVVRSLILESALLSGASGLVGWWVAQQCVRAFVSAQAGTTTAALSYTADIQLLVYAVVVSMIAGSLAGLPAALWMTRAGSSHTLRDVSRGITGGPRTKRLADVLITAEIALALVVLACAGLMARSVLNVYTANIGVNAANILTMSMYVPPESYPGKTEQISFYGRLVHRLRGIPGVQSVAIASVAPTDMAVHSPSAIGNAPLTDSGNQSTVGRMIVSPGYFETMEASVISGRDFNDFDDASAAPVAIVNQSFVNQHSATETLLGTRIQMPAGTTLQSFTIVGIASDIVQSDRTRQHFEALVYVPYMQRPQPNMFVFARTWVEPAALATAFSGAVEAMDANLPVPGLMPLTDRFARAYRFERNMTTILIGSAALALVLAVVGLYAVIAHSVGMRKREIGIRRALGANTQQITHLVLREAGVPLVAGLTIGVAVSVSLAPAMQPILVRVSSVDPVILGTASLVLAFGSVAACLLPARHALKIDPAIALRQD